jgi:hypothetical protein
MRQHAVQQQDGDEKYKEFRRVKKHGLANGKGRSSGAESRDGNSLLTSAGALGGVKQLAVNE